MLEESIAEVSEDTAAVEVAAAAVPSKPARPIESAQRHGYAASNRARLGSMTAAFALTFGMILAIMRAGFAPYHPVPLQPLVVDLIALPSLSPPRQRSPVPNTPITMPQPKQVETVATAVPAPSTIIPVVALAETAPTPRPVTISPTAVPERPAAAVPAPPAVRTADLSVRLLSAPQPRYPIESRRRREQGDVVLSVLLGTDGRVQEISVARSSGSDRLDKAALAAVSRWRWSPMIEAGVPAMVRGVVTLPFVLQG